MSRFVIRSETNKGGGSSKSRFFIHSLGKFQCEIRKFVPASCIVHHRKTKEFCPPGSGEFVNSINAQPIQSIILPSENSFPALLEFCELR